jgi:hypothetical protein
VPLYSRVCHAWEDGLYLGAPLLCIWVVPFAGVYWWETIKGHNYPPLDVRALSLFFAWLLSPILLIWCNAALLVEAVKERRARTA